MVTQTQFENLKNQNEDLNSNLESAKSGNQNLSTITTENQKLANRILELQNSMD